MVTGAKTAARDMNSEIAYLTRALKAPHPAGFGGPARGAGPGRIVEP